MQNSAAVADFGPGYGWRLIVQSWTPQGDGQPENGAGHVDSFPLPKAPAVEPGVAAVAAQRRPHRVADAAAERLQPNAGSGWSRATAASSPSATRTSTARRAACT